MGFFRFQIMAGLVRFCPLVRRSPLWEDAWVSRFFIIALGTGRFLPPVTRGKDTSRYDPPHYHGIQWLPFYG